MLIPTFRIELGKPVIAGLAVVGKFDGKHPSLAGATTKDSILCHSPHLRGADSKHEIRTFSVNRTITALAAGNMTPSEGTKELLLFGTETNLVAYDVENNADKFNKEIPESVFRLVYGQLNSSLPPLVIVGSNCSIQGFDIEGEEQYWTVASDNVSALNLRDVRKDGNLQLLVGSEDFEIRILEDTEMIAEVTETDAISNLTQLHGSFYAFSLKNGTIGVYNDETRVWHAKSKHTPVSMISFDLDSDGVEELVTGWSNGKLEVRNDENGELVYKDKFSSGMAQVLKADYRMDNRDEVVALSVGGQMRGYLPAEEEMQGQLMGQSKEEGAMQQLYQRKQELLQQLASFEKNIKQMKSGDQGAGTIPPNTTLSVTLKPSLSKQGLIMTLSTNNDTVIKLAVVTSDVLFDDGCKIWHPQRPTSALSFCICPSRNTEVDVVIKAIVGHTTSTQEHIFHIKHKLNRFGSYINFNPDRLETHPTSSVSFKCTERTNRIALWLSSSFHMDDPKSLQDHTTETTLKAAFRNVKTRQDLLMTYDNGDMKLYTDDMELAGDIIQGMCSFLKIEHMESVCSFPADMDVFKDVLARVEEHNDIRLKLSTEIADASNQVKNMVIRAEDARIQNEIQLMSTAYSNLYELNQELIGEYRKRANNHKELLKSLKEVNQMIQKASRLRMGQYKTIVVNSCRKAIQTHNIQTLLKIITLGNPGLGES